jgi:hypothetical protein
MIEVGDDVSGVIVGFIDIDASSNSVRLEKHDFKVKQMQVTVRVEPGKFAVFTIKAVLLPTHILAKVVTSTIFKPRGEVQYIKNDDDPMLQHKGKLN